MAIIRHSQKETAMRRFLTDESGATAIEYGLIASLISVAIVGVLALLGPKLSAVFQTVSDNL
jgi:pilus assembly protein Flp/PilA